MLEYHEIHDVPGYLGTFRKERPLVDIGTIVDRYYLPPDVDPDDYAVYSDRCPVDNLENLWKYIKAKEKARLK